jgi:catechol 2,3-dioxygenase-like lactoylglutathione lyase family enzyme
MARGELIVPVASLSVNPPSSVIPNGDMTMEIYRGRLIDHIHLRARDLAASKRFYRAVLESLGKGQSIQEDDKHFMADELWIDRADKATSTVHLAFQARDREAVENFYKAALAAGGRDNGAPGERRYHPGYFGAFVLDPDGNNIEAVYHGPFNSSADAIVIKPAG